MNPLDNHVSMHCSHIWVFQNLDDKSQRPPTDRRVLTLAKFLISRFNSTTSKNKTIFSSHRLHRCWQQSRHILKPLHTSQYQRKRENDNSMHLCQLSSQQPLHINLLHPFLAASSSVKSSSLDLSSSFRFLVALGKQPCVLKIGTMLIGVDPKAVRL